MNLREDKHWSYGARSWVHNAKGQQPFMAYAAVQSDKTAESMREILRELTDIRRNRPPTRKELDVARKNLVLRLPGGLETSDDVRGVVARSVIYGLPDDHLSRYVERVRAMPLETVRKTAATFLHPGSLTWVVVGDVAQIEAPVRKLALGKVQVLDADGKVLR